MGELKHLSELLEGAREVESSPVTTSTTSSDTNAERSTRGIPRGRRQDTFASLEGSREMASAYDQAKGVADGKYWCALLMGSPGNGKTHLALAAMHERGLDRSYFWKVPNFLDWLRNLAYGQELGIFAVLKDYVGSDFLLVLDDLGAENQTDWAAEQLYRVVDSRYDNKLPTIVTTNQPRERLDPRLLSRLAEGLVVCRGADRRREGSG